jgi:uncharacterized membrane protein
MVVGFDAWHDGGLQRPDSGTPRANGSARGPAVLYSRQIVYVLGAVWLALFAASFVLLQLTDPPGDGFTRGLNRLASFMTWQISAFVVAIAAALVTRAAAARGIERIKLVGYVPLAASLFLVASLVAIVAFRVYVEPQLT